MAGSNAEEWLEEWADENINVPQYHENKFAMAEEAAACRAAAAADGIDGNELLEAAGGDLLQYLLSRQTELTDRRREESD